MSSLIMPVPITIIINITVTTRVALAIALRNHSHELRSLSVGVSRTAWSQHGKSNAIFFQRQLNTLYYHYHYTIPYIITARHQLRCGKKKGMSGRYSTQYWWFPSIFLHPQYSHAPGAKYCLGGHGTCMGISREKQVFSSPLSVLRRFCLFAFGLW